jgi:hypothetical protein
MYRCGDCDTPAPDGNGCPKCGGPTLWTQAGCATDELLSYRMLRQSRQSATWAAKALIGFRWLLTLILFAITLGFVDLAWGAWEDGASDEVVVAVLIGGVVVCGGVVAGLIALIRWLAAGEPDAPTTPA